MTSGRPWPSQTACSFEFRPPLVRPIHRRRNPFRVGWQRCGARWLRRASGQVRRVDHQPVGLAAPGRERLEDAVEHAHLPPSDEAVVNRLVRPKSLGASRQRRSLWNTKMIPLITRRSSTLGTPCDNGNMARSDACALPTTRSDHSW